MGGVTGMKTQHPGTYRRPVFDLVLDAWPDNAQGQALSSLVASGDVAATELPYGFVGLRIVSSQTLLYVEEGRWHVAQIVPQPSPRRATVPQYQYPLRPA